MQIFGDGRGMKRPIESVLAYVIVLVALLGATGVIEQVDAWTRAGAVVECEVLEKSVSGGLTHRLAGRVDGTEVTMHVRPQIYHRVSVGDKIPCAVMNGEYVPICGSGTALYQFVTDNIHLKVKKVTITLPLVWLTNTKN